MGELEGKVAAITGAAAGIGLATARLFADAGARIVCADWRFPVLQEVLGSDPRNGSTIELIEADVSQEEEAEAIIDRATERFGGLDILVNNAAVMDGFQGVGTIDTAQWRRVLGVNLDGPMFTMRRAVPAMIARGGGSIVNIASVAGLRGASAGTAYSTSKTAVLGLTRSTAWLYAQEKIRCNAICPGSVDTNIMEGVSGPWDRVSLERLRPYNALAQRLQPDQLARAILFLASDAASAISGVALPVDGGWTVA